MYSAMSPAKLSLAKPTMASSGVWTKMYNDSFSGQVQDKEEFDRESQLESLASGAWP
jgi:hypothetical protein